jgi:hypothetical protein
MQPINEPTPEPWDPFAWMGAMWLALFALVFAATQGLAAVLLYLAVLTPLVVWRIRRDLGLRRTSA